jgi:hypothetical protein
MDMSGFSSGREDEWIQVQGYNRHSSESQPVQGQGLGSGLVFFRKNSFNFFEK